MNDTKKIEKGNDRVRKIVRLLGREVISRRGICGNMEVRARKNLWDLYMTPSMQQGYVRFLYPEHPNSPDQKYLLTDKGMEVYKALLEKAKGAVE